jgi:hypothetical protein
VRKADNLPPSCVDVKKSRGLSLLEPCGPVQAYSGTAFTASLSTLCNTFLHSAQGLFFQPVLPGFIKGRVI